MKKNNLKHRWNTTSYINRTSELNREDLEKLYPSESWALFRIITKVKSVIDLGCGNGAMSSIVYKINKKCNYTGLDHQSFLIKKAKIKYKHSKFLDRDLKHFVRENKKKYWHFTHKLQKT
jgi:trans-aconitate methyltransferase|tara:strand:- start:435 stop:794 length:360 start_codon:yes stop_codon:yes gene_type:complete